MCQHLSWTNDFSYDASNLLSDLDGHCNDFGGLVEIDETL